MAFLSEAEVEEMLLDQLDKLGYRRASDSQLGPDGPEPERESYADVFLLNRLVAAIDRLNPHIPAEARRDALKSVIASQTPGLMEENRRLHQAIIDGIDVEFYSDAGIIEGDKVRLVDFKDAAANDWLVINQFTVVEAGARRRPDVVLFLNGLPVAVIELKKPGGEHTTLTDAYNQLQTYKAEIPSLFRTNAALIISDGLTARIGSLTADEERFMPWRTVKGDYILPKGEPEMATLIAGVFEQRRFLDLLQGFIVFNPGSSGLVKILAGYHQFYAVQWAVESTVRATAVPEMAVSEAPAVYGLPDVRNYAKGDTRIGVIWHTQGSGKSLLMAFYAGQLIRHPDLENPTILVLTDRNDLDDQLFGTFAKCQDLIRQTPVQIDSRAELQQALQRAAGGVFFTTIQKFAPLDGETRYPCLTKRRNVVVIADEAHRSQYGFKARINREDGEYAYGFAKYIRDALPNASFIGFTGTPIEKADVNTPRVFGGYIDIYDLSRAVEDGATVPIYYQSRLARIALPEEEKPQIDEEIEDLTEDEVETEQARLKRKWSKVEKLVGAKERLKMVAADLVQHFEDRLHALEGKAMVVCMSRRICVALYDEIVALRPDWHSDEDGAGKIKIVMTSGGANDRVEWQPHIGKKARRDLLAKRAKDPNDPLKLVIVRDMWLTGFDAPAMHTMYIDKPMRGHGLMQAIARVNRVFRDKPGGLVVDYIGIAQNLKEALSQYSDSDQQKAGINEEQAIAVLLDKYEIVKNMFHGFPYQRRLEGSAHERLCLLAEAIEWILAQQEKAAAKESTDEAKERTHRRYVDAVLALSRAFSLVPASDEARKIRDELAFFQAVREALIKPISGSSGSAGREFAVHQLIDRSIASVGILDILTAAGFSRPNLAILSEEFLAEIAQVEKKNLALEALKKVLEESIRSRKQTHVVETKRFSERLEDAIARYHRNAISTIEMLQELIDLARDIRAARNRGEEEGLSPEEIAFYDALAENDSAVEVMGNEALKVIAHELLTSLKGSVTVDWARRESARARIRMLVKRILRKYGYPPDLQDAAVQTVLQQAEALAAAWTKAGRSPVL